MDRALVICDSQKGAEFFQSFLTQNGLCDEVTVVTDADSGRRKIAQMDYDLCLINAPLKSENGDDLAIEIGDKNITQVILFVPGEYADDISAKVENFGVITVPKPIVKSNLFSAVKLAAVTQHRVNMARAQADKLQHKLDELRIVSRAKCVLVAALGVDEEGAHKYIEKMAMDQRMSRIEIAEDILRTYEV